MRKKLGVKTCQICWWIFMNIYSKLLLPEAFWAQNAPNSVWRSIQRSYRPPSWIKGSLLLRKGEKKRTGRRGGGWEGKVKEGEEKGGKRDRMGRAPSFMDPRYAPVKYGCLRLRTEEANRELTLNCSWSSLTSVALTGRHSWRNSASNCEHGNTTFPSASFSSSAW